MNLQEEIEEAEVLANLLVDSKSPDDLPVTLGSGREAIVKLVEGADGVKKYQFDRFADLIVESFE